MSNFTRRNVLKTGAAVAGASAANLALFAQAWAQASPFKPEKGAAIQLLRWKRFVQSEEDSFMALVAAFTKATSVEVKVINESLDDVQPKASVAANTNQGPDMFWGLYSLPHLFPNKVIRRQRRCRLPRQEVRRLGADRRGLRQGPRASGSRSRWPTTATSSTSARA